MKRLQSLLNVTDPLAACSSKLNKHTQTFWRKQTRKETVGMRTQTSRHRRLSKCKNCLNWHKRRTMILKNQVKSLNNATNNFKTDFWKKSRLWLIWRSKMIKLCKSALYYKSRMKFWQNSWRKNKLSRKSWWRSRSKLQKLVAVLPLRQKSQVMWQLITSYHSRTYLKESRTKTWSI
jgi:hypothetical protein